jgi:hypothetical protein
LAVALIAALPVGVLSGGLAITIAITTLIGLIGALCLVATIVLIALASLLLTPGLTCLVVVTVAASLILVTVLIGHVSSGEWSKWTAHNEANDDPIGGS